MPLNNDTPKVRNNPNENRPKDEAVIAAHDQAEKDIEDDAELTIHPRPEDDLDEGEIARFEDGNDGVQEEQDPLDAK
ncbi:MAG: hypothetical protein JWQ40_742 [Segetibacter sp.]|nr:hypothetical protein [Segetibacter sp.]